MTFDELEDWATSRSEHSNLVYVGKNITVADIAEVVQHLLVAYESCANELDYTAQSVRDLEVALERGCD